MASRNKHTRAKDSPLAVAKEDRWRVESDLDTFFRWQEIKKDPKRLANVKALAKEKLEQMAAAASLEGGGDADD